MAKFSRQLQDIANALVDVAAETKAVPEVVRDVQMVAHAFAEDPMMATELMDPSITREKRQTALKKGLHKEVEPLVLNVLLVLQEKDLLDELHEFEHAVISAASARADHHHAVVRSTIKLTATERSALTKMLEKKFGGTIELEEHLDQTILGGLVVDLEGWRYDGSVLGTSRRLTETLYTQ